MTKKKVYNFSTNRKLLVLGDTMSGKTCLLYAFKNETYTDTDPTTNLDIYSTEVDLDGNIVSRKLNGYIYFANKTMFFVSFEV